MDTTNTIATSTSRRTRVERIMSLVAVLAMLAAAASSALASQEAGAAGNRPYLAEPYTAIDCELLARTTIDRQRATPPLAGLAALRNARVGYDMWHPAGWSTMVFGSGDASMYLAPAQQDTMAHFSIQTFDTGKEIAVQDLPALIEHFDMVIREMPETEVALAVALVVSRLSGLRSTVHLPLWQHNDRALGALAVRRHTGVLSNGRSACRGRL